MAQLATGILTCTPEHCLVFMVVSTFMLVLKKPHVSNGKAKWKNEQWSKGICFGAASSCTFSQTLCHPVPPLGLSTLSGLTRGSGHPPRTGRRRRGSSSAPAACVMRMDICFMLLFVCLLMLFLFPLFVVVSFFLVLLCFCLLFFSEIRFWHHLETLVEAITFVGSYLGGWNQEPRFLNVGAKWTWSIRSASRKVCPIRATPSHPAKKGTSVRLPGALLRLGGHKLEQQTSRSPLQCCSARTRARGAKSSARRYVECW